MFPKYLFVEIWHTSFATKITDQKVYQLTMSRDYICTISEWLCLIFTWELKKAFKIIYLGTMTECSKHSATLNSKTNIYLFILFMFLSNMFWKQQKQKLIKLLRWWYPITINFCVLRKTTSSYEYSKEHIKK